MTEPIETTEIPAAADDHQFQMPTTVRGLRHYADKQSHKICAALGGQPGLTKDQQIERVQYAIRAATRSLEALAILEELVTTRDFDAHMAQKQREQEATKAKFDAMVSDEFQDEDEDTDEDTDD